MPWRWTESAADARPWSVNEDNQSNTVTNLIGINGSSRVRAIRDIPVYCFVSEVAARLWNIICRSGINGKVGETGGC